MCIHLQHPPCGGVECQYGSKGISPPITSVEKVNLKTFGFLNLNDEFIYL